MKRNYIFSFIGLLGIILTIFTVIIHNRITIVHKDCSKTLRTQDSIYKVIINNYELNLDTLSNNYFIVNKKDLKLQTYVNRKQAK